MRWRTGRRQQDIDAAFLLTRLYPLLSAPWLSLVIPYFFSSATYAATIFPCCSFFLFALILALFSSSFSMILISSFSTLPGFSFCFFARAILFHFNLLLLLPLIFAFFLLLLIFISPPYPLLTFFFHFYQPSHRSDLLSIISPLSYSLSRKSHTLDFPDGTIFPRPSLFFLVPPREKKKKKILSGATFPEAPWPGTLIGRCTRSLANHQDKEGFSGSSVTPAPCCRPLLLPYLPASLPEPTLFCYLRPTLRLHTGHSYLLLAFLCLFLLSASLNSSQAFSIPFSFGHLLSSFLPPFLPRFLKDFLYLPSEDNDVPMPSALTQTKKEREREREREREKEREWMRGRGGQGGNESVPS